MKPVLPISIRTFLLVFLPMSLALIAGFVHLERGTEAAVREGLRVTLAEAQQANLREWETFRSRHRSLLVSMTQNSTLKAGMALWNSSGYSNEARRTVEDQLGEVGTELGYDLLALSDTSGMPVTGVKIAGGNWQAMAGTRMGELHEGLLEVDGALYETLAVPVNNDNENLGRLVVGKRFDLYSVFGAAALVRAGRVVDSSVPGIGAADVERTLRGCIEPWRQCEVQLNGESFLVLRPGEYNFGKGYLIFTFHSIDAASAGIVASSRKAFRVSLLATMLAALLAGLWVTLSLIRPLAQFVKRLRESKTSGQLHGDFPTNSSTKEINELARAFNTAAGAIADSRHRLDLAYIEFIKTMAQTLDARDPYTAGHSTRVSDYAVAVARAMRLSSEQTEIIRIGADLHDIGKIGVPDHVLQKPGRLTDEEMEIIKAHPVIGRRILTGVARFRPYLEIVELHHENHDGTGYPWGLRGDDIPLCARIVHVVDAFDAMTTSRPYRKALRIEEANEVLRRHSGTMFDPEVVNVFLSLANAAAAAEAEHVSGDLTALSREVEQFQHEALIHRS